MFVTKLIVGDDIKSNPSWADVEVAISKLDGHTVDLLSLAPDSPNGIPTGDHHMTIGGGDESRYLVYLTEDNLSFWNLVDEARKQNESAIQMTVGGQVGLYRENQFVSKAQALRAAKSYYNDGTRAPDLLWLAS